MTTAWETTRRSTRALQYVATTKTYRKTSIATHPAPNPATNTNTYAHKPHNNDYDNPV